MEIKLFESENLQQTGGIVFFQKRKNSYIYWQGWGAFYHVQGKTNEKYDTRNDAKSKARAISLGDY